MIGYSTNWNFKVGTGVHVQFHGAPGTSSGTGGGHADDHAALYHEENDIREGIAVSLNVSPVPVIIGTSTKLDFFVNEKPGNIPVSLSALEFNHTKLMHVVGIRSDMNEFFHIHPEPIPMREYDPVIASTLSVPYRFSNPGRYKIW